MLTFMPFTGTAGATSALVGTMSIGTTYEFQPSYSFSLSGTRDGTPTSGSWTCENSWTLPVVECLATSTVTNAPESFSIYYEDVRWTIGRTLSLSRLCDESLGILGDKPLGAGAIVVTMPIFGGMTLTLAGPALVYLYFDEYVGCEEIITATGTATAA